MSLQRITFVLELKACLTLLVHRLVKSLVLYTTFIQAFLLSQYSFICVQYLKCSDT